MLNKWKQTISKFVCFVLTCQLFILTVWAKPDWPSDTGIMAEAGIVMDMDSGAILYGQNIHLTYPPASITKILTALIVLENCNLDDTVTFSTTAVNQVEADSGNKISVVAGDQLSVEDCLYSMLLVSCNQAANALAEHTAGSIPAFVDMMNEKAAELGCTNTHFANPHGLFDENHYTTAHDMALIAKAAYQNETFRIITGTARYTIPPTNKHDEPTDLQNHNEMLYPFKTLKYRYEYCTGGKTGYTDIARSTLVTYAEKDGMSLVCVVMHTESPNQWTDSRNLFDYAFDNFQLFNIADNETRYMDSEAVEVGALNNTKAFVDIDANANIVLPKTTDFNDAASEITYDDVSENVVGTLAYTYAGRQVGKADIVTTGAVVDGYIFNNQSEVEQETDTEEETVSTMRIRPRTILLIVAGILLAVGLIFAGKKFYDNYYIIRHNREVRRNRKEQFRQIKSKSRRRRRHRR